MDHRALLDEAQLRAADALPDRPRDAARSFREAFRHALAAGDRVHAAVELMGLAVAYSLHRSSRATVRMLELATRYAPELSTPHVMLAAEYERQAAIELERGAFVEAKQALSRAAIHHERARAIADPR